MLDRPFGLVPGNQDMVVLDSCCLAGDHSLLDNVDDKRTRFEVHDAANLMQRAADRFGLRPAGQEFRDGIDQLNPAVGIGGDDAVSNR